jgi:hypothetical protein
MSSSKRAPFFADLFAVVWTLGGTISIGRLDRL